MTHAPWRDQLLFTEEVAGSDRPAHYVVAETMDGLYAPYVLRTPADEGSFPFILLAYGNGGGGVSWLRERVQTHGHIMERLLDAGYACAWARYRTEVDLGYQAGGSLVVDRRQGMDLMNRAPLEYEDEVSIIRHVQQHRAVDASRIGHVGVSHAGEMMFKIGSQYDGLISVAVACEPANHEFLDLDIDHTAHVNAATGLRDIEEMQMRDPAAVRARINEPLARARIAPLTTPIFVMGRDDDALQGIFRVSHDLLVESGKSTAWSTWDHPLHGYIFPEVGPDGVLQLDAVQVEAIDAVISYLDLHLKTT